MPSPARLSAHSTFSEPPPPHGPIHASYRFIIDIPPERGRAVFELWRDQQWIRISCLDKFGLPTRRIVSMLRQGSMIRVHVIPLNEQDPQSWPSIMFEKQQNLTYPKGITPNHVDDKWVKRTIEKKEERDNKGKPKFWVKLEHKSSHYVLRWKERSWEELATQVAQDAATAHAARLAATCAKSEHPYFKKRRQDADHVGEVISSHSKDEHHHKARKVSPSPPNPTRAPASMDETRSRQGAEGSASRAQRGSREAGRSPVSLIDDTSDPRPFRFCATPIRPSARNLVRDPPAFRSHPFNSSKITRPADPRLFPRESAAHAPSHPTQSPSPSTTPSMDQCFPQRPPYPRTRSPPRAEESSGAMTPGNYTSPRTVFTALPSDVILDTVLTVRSGMPSPAATPPAVSISLALAQQKAAASTPSSLDLERQTSTFESELAFPGSTTQPLPSPVEMETGRIPPTGLKRRVCSDSGTASTSSYMTFAPYPKGRRCSSSSQILPPDNTTPYIDSPVPSQITRAQSRPSMILSCGKSLDSPLHTGLLPPGRILQPSARVVMDDNDGGTRMAMIRKQIDKWQEVLEEFPQTKMDCMRHVDRLEKEMADMRDRCSEI
ncbi:hypothetical protein, variant [Cryptococcus amylolentus CBS 6039]|uniref:Uncharacterized protein n=1 Tax=Cryptococcus amylolentus CBS 6039 TaxID=1295533 RepID=A0A1E3HQ86_9TREE|nr:hypothetical protein L202_04990 [Cryptococcus amylolentus CBS 6039]XP_018993113.1 hypothetical protein, variant [Cryptococcus amylolentus CBS 6039]ODN77876.1 hypothetical protein L202_04990 [Cryptococcus amylolentus CBS 6039]ODN77877.1 hypothetical protein, variant [Cryptococcus amylolentus CBS 6039]